MTLMQQILRMLEDRTDIEIIYDEGDEIWGTQLRRLWNLTVLNPDSMQPVERQQFLYYGQTFVIKEPRYTKLKEMVKEQRDFAVQYGRVGTIVIFAKTIDDVINYLGTEPTNITEYLQRREK